MKTKNGRDSRAVGVVFGLLIAIGIFLYGNYSKNYDQSGLTTVMYWVIAFFVFVGCMIMLASIAGSELNKKLQRNVIATDKRLSIEVLAAYLIATSMFVISNLFFEDSVSEFLVSLSILVAAIGTIRLYSLISFRLSRNWPFTSDKQQSSLVTIILVIWIITLFL